MYSSFTLSWQQVSEFLVVQHFKSLNNDIHF